MAFAYPWDLINITKPSIADVRKVIKRINGELAHLKDVIKRKPDECAIGEFCCLWRHRPLASIAEYAVNRQATDAECQSNMSSKRLITFDVWFYGFNLNGMEIKILEWIRRSPSKHYARFKAKLKKLNPRIATLPYDGPECRIRGTFRYYLCERVIIPCNRTALTVGPKPK